MGLPFEKPIVSTLKFIKIEFLTTTVSFGTGFTFYKGSRANFSEGPSPGPLMKYQNNLVKWKHPNGKKIIFPTPTIRIDNENTKKVQKYHKRARRVYHPQ